MIQEPYTPSLLNRRWLIFFDGNGREIVEHLSPDVLFVELTKLPSVISDPSMPFTEKTLFSILDACFQRIQPPFPEKVHQDPVSGMIAGFVQRQSESTANALEKLLPEIRQRGFVVQTVSGESIKFFPSEIQEMVDQMEQVLKNRVATSTDRY